MLTCEICGKVFATRNALSGHQVAHKPIQLHTCDICKKTFKNAGALIMHTRKCEKSLLPKVPAFNDPQQLYCTFCSKSCHNRNSLAQHTIRCKENPEHIQTYVEGFNMKRSCESQKFPWNKGLTKQTDERVAANSKAISCSMTGKPGHAHTEEEKRHLSEVAKQRGLGGFNMRSKGLDYKGVKLDSTYELAVAQSLDQYGINWERCGRFLYRTPEGIERTYVPDFYLPDYDVYLDPKNDFLINNINPRLGYKDADKIRWVMEQNQVRILILDKDHLTWDKFKRLLES